MLITELNTKMNRETRRDYIGSVHKLDNEIVKELEKVFAEAKPILSET